MYGDCCLACVDCRDPFCPDHECPRFDPWGDPVEGVCGDCNDQRRAEA